MSPKEYERLHNALTLALSLLKMKEPLSEKERADCAEEFRQGLRSLDSVTFSHTWKSEELKKVFDRLIEGRSDLPDGVLAGKLKLVNDSLKGNS